VELIFFNVLVSGNTPEKKGESMKAETIIYWVVSALKTLSPQQNPTRKENKSNRTILVGPQL